MTYFYAPSLPLCLKCLLAAHNLTSEKRDNNYSPHPLTPTSWLPNNVQLITGMLWVSVMYTIEHAVILRLVGLMPRSSVSLLLGFSAIA